MLLLTLALTGTAVLLPATLPACLCVHRTPAWSVPCAGERFTPLLPGMCACIAQLKPEQQHNMDKLLTSWRSEQVVPGSIITACQDKLPFLSGAGPDAEHHAAAAEGCSSPAAVPAAAANGGYSGTSGYVQAMAAAAVAAAAEAAGAPDWQAAGTRGSSLTPAKRVSQS